MYVLVRIRKFYFINLTLVLVIILAWSGMLINRTDCHNKSEIHPFTQKHLQNTSAQHHSAVLHATSLEKDDHCLNQQVLSVNVVRSRSITQVETDKRSLVVNADLTEPSSIYADLLSWRFARYGLKLSRASLKLYLQNQSILI